MANITKRNNRYSIRVSCGYDVSGKQIFQTMTWTSEKGMTKKQIESCTVYDGNCDDISAV